MQIKLSNLEKTALFYDAIMHVLGYKKVLEIENVVIGYGIDVNDMFEIKQANTTSLLSASVHIAFNAYTKAQVGLFYKTALLHGGKCNGKPGFRKEYAEHCYAVFVIDLNGHNIEAVFCKPL
ncbi:VOC family protein [Candidatus Dependentiae bacterium]|nr:MAG: VOC family protein [Candidatus Dependentiae bacterium]